MLVSQRYSKSLIIRRNEALKIRSELREQDPTIQGFVRFPARGSLHPHLPFFPTLISISSFAGATRAVTLDISEAFDRVWHAGLLHKLKSYGISGQIFSLISSFPSNRRLRVVLDGKSSQEYPVNVGVPQGSILGPTLFLLYINDLPDDVICDIEIYADDTTLYSKCDRASDL